jgi:hypothetical protein
VLFRTVLDTLRKPFFWIALGCALLGVLVEIGGSTWINLRTSVQGLASPDLALLDGLVLLTLSLIAAPLIWGNRIQGRIQGIVSLVVSIGVVLAACSAFVAAFKALVLMMALLLSPPFGTLAYLALYRDFPADEVRNFLSVLMVLKLFLAGFLVAAQQKFLESKSLLLILLCSFLNLFILTFLLGLVPGFLNSVTDAIAAIVACIVGIVWGVLYIFQSICSIGKAIT